MGASTFAESDSNSNKKLSLEEGVKACVSLIKKECGSDGFEKCAQKSKQRKKVFECQEYLLKNSKRLSKDDVESFGAPIKKEFQEVVKTNRDNDQCREVYQKVCGSDLSMNECFQKKANQFPSFCRNMNPSDPQAVLKSAGIRSDTISGCAQNIQKACKLEIPDHREGKDNMKAYRAATEKYQQCLQESIKKSAACKNIIAKDKNSGATQLIE